MSDEHQTHDAPEGGDGDSSKKKKKLIIIIAAVLLLIVAVVGGLFVSGMIGHKAEGGEAGEHGGKPDPLLEPNTNYLDLEEFLVNLNNPGKQVSFLKMTVTLELPNLKTKEVVEGKMPLIRDTFQIYLRELRNTDLQGSAGIHRLREELLLRVNKIVDPHPISNILFKEIIVQ